MKETHGPTEAEVHAKPNCKYVESTRPDMEFVRHAGLNTSKQKKTFNRRVLPSTGSNSTMVHVQL